MIERLVYQAVIASPWLLLMSYLWVSLMLGILAKRK